MIRVPNGLYAGRLTTNDGTRQGEPVVLKFGDVIVVRTKNTTTATAGSGATIDSFGGIQITSLG